MNPNTTQLITVRGLIATTPRIIETEDGRTITTFRFAAPSTKLDPSTGTYVTDITNWFTVTTFGRLAINAGESLSKGDRVIVYGELKLRDWDNGERSGTSVEIHAITVAPDLLYGTASFIRVPIEEE